VLAREGIEGQILDTAELPPTDVLMP